MSVTLTYDRHDRFTCFPGRRGMDRLHTSQDKPLQRHMRSEMRAAWILSSHYYLPAQVFR